MVWSYIRLHVSDSTSLFISTPKGENILERNNSYNKTPLSILPVHAHVVTSWRSWQPGSAQRGRMGCCSMLCRSDLRSHPIFHWWQGLLDSRVKLELESMAWSRYCDLMVMHIYIYINYICTFTGCFRWLTAAVPGSMNSRATNSGNPIKLRSVALFQREETQVLPCIDSTPANGHQDFSRFWSSLLSAVYVTFAAPMRRSRWGGFCLTFLSQKWQDWIVAPRLLLQCCKKKVARFRNFFYFGLSFVRKPPNLWRSTLLWLKMMRRRLELQHLESWKVAESIQVDVDPYFEGPPKYTEDVHVPSKALMPSGSPISQMPKIRERELCKETSVFFFKKNSRTTHLLGVRTS